MAVNTSRVMGLALVLVGILLCGWWGPQAVITAGASESWPTVTGEVLGTKLLSTGSGGTGPSYRVQYRYRYQVDGRSYENDRNTAGPGKRHRTRGEAEQEAARHREGSPVVVHYNPDDPADALLTPGRSGRAWLLVIIGAGAVVWGGIVLRRSRNRSQQG